MFQNYFKLAYRNLVKNPVFSLLNTLGWALGMAVCLIMLLFVRHEQSFDRFHTKADRIFRLTEFQRFPGMQEQQVPMSMLPMGPAFANDYPEIETFVRLRQLGSVDESGEIVAIGVMVIGVLVISDWWAVLAPVSCRLIFNLMVLNALMV